MRNFLKLIFASFIGSFLFWIFVGIAFFILIFIASLSGDSKPSLKRNSILEITLDKPIYEGPLDETVGFFDFNSKSTLYKHQIIESIKAASKDENIKGISLKMSLYMGGISQAQEIRNALKEFRKSGKFIYSYNNNITQGSYYIASVADSIFLNPTGLVELTGLATEVLFFKEMGDKYGIDFNVIRHGEFKSAVEPFMRNDLSEENRLQLTELLNGVWKTISSDISKSRKISLENFNKAVDSVYSFIPELAKENKLFDRLLQESEYDDLLRKKLKLSEDEKPNIISLDDYYTTITPEKKGDKIAVLLASGEIVTGEESSGIQSKNLIKVIKEIKDDEDIKALVLRVNSPGGSANASDEILYELFHLKKKKPIVVSMGDVAASGGYYISMAADSIFAMPTTITGSIGVLGMLPTFTKMANNVGIHSDIVRTHKNSGFYSATNGLSPDAKNIVYKSIDHTYDRFVGFVMKNRKMTYEQVDAVGGGRVWVGTKAKEIGLVDGLGDLERAVKSAAKLAKLKEYHLAYYPTPKDKFQEFLKSFSGESSTKVDAAIRKELGEESYQLYRKIKSWQNSKGAMLITPYQIKF